MPYIVRTNRWNGGARYSPPITVSRIRKPWLITPTVVYADVLGEGFDSFVQIIGITDPRANVTGAGFDSEPSIYGAAIVTGYGFDSSPTITAAVNEYAYINGYGFDSYASIVGIGGYSAAITGRGFNSDPEIYGAAIVAGQGFYSDPTISGTVNYYASVIGEGFDTDPTITGTVHLYATIIGQGFDSGLAYNDILGRGFDTAPSIIGAIDANYAQAYVLNILTNQVTRYTSYPFFHLAKIGTDYYGFNADGIYKLTGSVDLTTGVASSITTKETDFGTYQSKNVHVLYANADDEFDVTPIVDEEEKFGQSAIFNGRKVKLGRGNKGRYWAFKIDNFSALHGLEYLPEALQRRVK